MPHGYIWKLSSMYLYHGGLTCMLWRWLVLLQLIRLTCYCMHIISTILFHYGRFNPGSPTAWSLSINCCNHRANNYCSYHSTPHKFTPLHGKRKLMACLLSDKHCKTLDFLNKHPISSSTLGILELRNSTSRNSSLFCSERHDDPFSLTVKSVLDFISKLYEEGKQYSSLNKVCIVFCGAYTGKRYPMKGVFPARPSLTRYSKTWDAI